METFEEAKARYEHERAHDPAAARLDAHLWDLEHPEEAAALKAARIAECRALGIEIGHATDADEPSGSGLVVADNCAICGAAVEVHMPPSVCPDCQAST
jgi:rubrerythrin